MRKGLIFNIQRFSVHDGPGIRTTVFLKGCPLSCRWCANPESNRSGAELLHTPASCIGCRSCAAACPQGAIAFPKGVFHYDAFLCNGCFACASLCPTHALTVEGSWYTVPELLTELKRREFPMAIVSNKLQEGVDSLWELYFKEYLHTAIGARDGIRKKPAPDTVIEALKILGVSRERAVYIGDSEVDIATARNSEMDCITVTWGFRTREEQKKAGAVKFVDKPEDIIPLLYSSVL